MEYGSWNETALVAYGAWQHKVLDSGTSYPLPLMSDWRVIRKYGAVLTGIVTGICPAVLAFTDFVKIPFDARVVCVGATGLVTVAVFCLLLSKTPKKETGPKAIGIILRWLILLLLSGGVIAALELTAAYHNVRVLRDISSNCPNVGSIEIQPPRFPLALTIRVWVPQTQGVRIEKFSPASWNREDPVNWQESNRTQFGATLLLSGFKTPQVFGIWYQLNAPADTFSWQAIPDRENVRVLDRGQLRRYRICSYVYGGGLWLIGVCFCLLRWFW